MTKTIEDQFKRYTEVSPTLIEHYRDFLYTKGGVLCYGNKFKLEVSSDVLILQVDDGETFTNISFLKDNMNVEVKRDNERSMFQVEYEDEGDWIFQLNTKYDVGFLDGLYMDHLRSLKEYYA